MRIPGASSNDFSRCGANEPFALRVIGDDMAPEFCDGNIIVVDPGGLMMEGCYVIARHREDTVLRMLQVNNGHYYLYCNSTQTVEETDLQSIIGVVSQKAGRRRRDRKRYDI